MNKSEHLRYTTTALLMDRILTEQGGPGLRDTITSLRASSDKRSWRAVARELSVRTGVRVTHESVRLWSEDWTAAEAAA